MEKITLKINKISVDSLPIDISKLRDKDLGKKEIIKAIQNSTKARKYLVGKNITSIDFSLSPKKEINVKTRKTKVKIGVKNKISLISKEIANGNIENAQKKTAKLILYLINEFENNKIKSEEISSCLEQLWWSNGFIDKMPEPLNSAVLEGADFNYYLIQGKHSTYHLKEAKNILNYLKNSAEQVLKKYSKRDKD